MVCWPENGERRVDAVSIFEKFVNLQWQNLQYIRKKVASLVFKTRGKGGQYEVLDWVKNTYRDFFLSVSVCNFLKACKCLQSRKFTFKHIRKINFHLTRQSKVKVNTFLYSVSNWRNSFLFLKIWASISLSFSVVSSYDFAQMASIVYVAGLKKLSPAQSRGWRQNIMANTSLDGKDKLIDSLYHRQRKYEFQLLVLKPHKAEGLPTSWKMQIQGPWPLPTALPFTVVNHHKKRTFYYNA